MKTCPSRDGEVFFDWVYWILRHAGSEKITPNMYIFDNVASVAYFIYVIL